MADLIPRTPLGTSGSSGAAWYGNGDTVLLREMPLFGCIDLRLDAREQRAVDAAASVLGAKLPVTPNTWVEAGPAALLWQAYDEWLIVTSDGAQAALGVSLRHALAGVRSAVTDVSDLRAAFELRGPRARDVLQKGCAVDLHPRVFGAGACVQTALARVRVTLRLTAASEYQVLVERSYARYLWSWLADAAMEYAAAE